MATLHSSNSPTNAIFFRSFFCTQVMLCHTGKGSFWNHIAEFELPQMRLDFRWSTQSDTLRTRFYQREISILHFNRGWNGAWVWKYLHKTMEQRESWLSWWWYWLFVYRLVGKGIPYHHFFNAGFRERSLTFIARSLGFKGIFALRTSLYRYAY